MPRVSVPDDYEGRGTITVAGTADSTRRYADVQLDSVRHARDLTIREDEQGRYVGPPEQHASEVRAYLGTTETTEDTSDGSDAADTDSGGENEPTTQDLVDAGECPWCEDYEGDHVGQHASSAHPDEWDAYKSET